MANFKISKNIILSTCAMVLYLLLIHFAKDVISFKFWFICSIGLMVFIIGVQIFTKSLDYKSISLITFMPLLTYINLKDTFGNINGWRYYTPYILFCLTFIFHGISYMVVHYKIKKTDKITY